MNEEKQTVQEQEKTTVEQNPVLVVGTTQKEVASYLKGYCTKKKIQFIQMKEGELHGYLNKVDPKYKDNLQFRTLKTFVESKENREEALNQAIKLYTIMTGNNNIEGAENFIFSKTDAVHRTTLSHKQFENIVNLWEVFNLIIKIDNKKQLYRFNFQAGDQRTSICNGIQSLVRATVGDIARYNANIDADKTLTEEEKKAKKDELIQNVLRELQ